MQLVRSFLKNSIKAFSKYSLPFLNSFLISEPFSLFSCKGKNTHTKKRSPFSVSLGISTLAKGQNPSYIELYIFPSSLCVCRRPNKTRFGTALIRFPLEIEEEIEMGRLGKKKKSFILGPCY